MAYGGGVYTLTPTFARLFREQYQQSLWIWFFGRVTKILLADLKKNQGSSCPSKLAHDLFLAGSNKKFAIFEIFRAYLREF